MEKLIFYRLWYFEDFKKGKKFYFEDKETAEIVRFSAYSGYDYERLTTKNYFVPVSLVKSVLIPEGDIDKIKLCVVQKSSEEEMV